MVPSSTESRALELLGLGTPPVQVASALGVTESRISQLLSQEDFASAVANLRYQNLLSNTSRDSKADSLEDKILAKLETSLDMVYQPLVLAKLYQIVNAAKRRGQALVADSGGDRRVVNIDMPIKVLNQFNVNIHNQVIQAGNQDLVTIQPKTLLDRVRGNRDEKLEQGRIASDRN